MKQEERLYQLELSISEKEISLFVTPSCCYTAPIGKKKTSTDVLQEAQWAFLNRVAVACLRGEKAVLNKLIETLEQD